MTKNSLDKDEEIQERMVPGRGGKGSPEPNVTECGQEMRGVDNGKIMEHQK